MKGICVEGHLACSAFHLSFIIATWVCSGAWCAPPSECEAACGPGVPQLERGVSVEASAFSHIRVELRQQHRGPVTGGCRTVLAVFS